MLQDKDRIFTNLYGLHDWGLKGALARGVWGPLGVWIFDDSPGSEALIDYALFAGPRATPPAIGNDRVDLLKGHDLTEDLWAVPVPALERDT